MRRKKWTWGEIAIIIGIGLVLAGLLQPSNVESKRRSLLKAIKNWTPPPEQPIGRPELLSSTAIIVGNWARGYRHGCRLVIEATDTPDVYTAEFSTIACTWKTRATRQGTRIQLSEPVSDYFENVFDALWIIELDSNTFLLPICLVENFNKYLDENEGHHLLPVFTQHKD